MDGEVVVWNEGRSIQFIYSILLFLFVALQAFVLTGFGIASGHWLAIVVGIAGVVFWVRKFKIVLKSKYLLETSPDGIRVMRWKSDVIPWDMVTAITVDRNVIATSHFTNLRGVNDVLAIAIKQGDEWDRVEIVPSLGSSMNIETLHAKLTARWQRALAEAGNKETDI